MSSYKHKSGAQKRSEKEKRDQEAKKGSRTLFQVGVLKATEEDKQDERTEDSHESYQLNPEVEALEARNNSDGEVNVEENVVIGDATNLSPFNIGTLCGSPTTKQLENIIRSGPAPFQKQFPRDADGQHFPLSVLQCKHENGEISERKWLAFSPSREALYCIPCRLFSHSIKKHSQSALATASGWDKSTKWKKLWTRVPTHEKGTSHRACYLSWRELQTRLQMNAGVDVMVEDRMVSEWKKLLSRMIDVTIFL